MRRHWRLMCLMPAKASLPQMAFKYWPHWQRVNHICLCVFTEQITQCIIDWTAGTIHEAMERETKAIGVLEASLLTHLDGRFWDPISSIPVITDV